MYGLDLKNDNLLRIDKKTCKFTIVGSIGFDAVFAQGMDFDDENNVLYLAAYNANPAGAELRVADTDTGNTVSLGPLGDGYIEIDGFAIATRRPLDWVSLSKKSGSFAAGVDTFNVIFDAHNTNEGTYSANITFDGTQVNNVPQMLLTLEVLPEPAALSLLILCVLCARATKARS